MGYWKTTQERFAIPDRSTHAWADMLKQSLAVVEPDSLAELEAKGELAAFLSVKVDECIKSIEAMQAQGMSYQEAKECAFDSMLPKAPEEIEDWEREEAEQEAIDGFSEWIDQHKGDQSG